MLSLSIQTHARLSTGALARKWHSSAEAKWPWECWAFKLPSVQGTKNASI